MVVSEKGLRLIGHFEGMRLTSYQDSVGVWTIGVGHTGPEVGPDQTCTPTQASTWLKADVEEAEEAVNRLVNVPLTQAQFDALVSLVFNIGSGAFSRSTLLTHLNAREYLAASAQFVRWKYAGGKVVKGLAKRREAEMRLFNGEEQIYES